MSEKEVLIFSVLEVNSSFRKSTPATFARFAGGFFRALRTTCSFSELVHCNALHELFLWEDGRV